MKVNICSEKNKLFVLYFYSLLLNIVFFFIFVQNNPENASDVSILITR